VLQLAEQYGVSRLKSICEEHLKLGLTTENVSDLLESADFYSCPSLRSYCLDFITRHFGKVRTTASFQKLSPALFVAISHRLPYLEHPADRNFPK